MEGATTECTIAQLGSATFDITIQREGEPSHQLHTAPDIPHPITVAAEVIRVLNELNVEMEQEYIEDIGYASYFIGSVNSGQFYNQFPNKANLVGVRRYSPQVTFEEMELEMRTALDRIAEAFHVRINLDLVKVRDGYRVDKNSPAIDALVKAIRKVRGIDPPLVGKKLVTDAGLIMKAIHAPTLCHGPDQHFAHGDVEYVEIKELELSVKVYLQFLIEICELHETGVNL
ncbi:MAG: deacylase [Bacilli bacterium]|nr:deacylase [Bacilli bacterium]